jgi:hypothetical protein
MSIQFTTARDIAELLNLPLPRIYEVTRKGFFPNSVVVRIGRQIRYNREGLLLWLQNGGTVEQANVESTPKGK